ncbi:GCN5-related N-acetyltransferase domain protein [mine drainage metagenome]|uniref:GCN5-related N-acetyltransferase domain protein n=2 Tax=mine drainage metagenome TaxID=410659 RepID=T0YR15_9ZZZZ
MLEGPQVRLRAPTEADYLAIFRWYNDAEIVAPFDRFEVDTWESFVSAIESAPNDPRSVAPRWIVEERADGRTLGFVGYYSPHPILEFLDVWYVVGDRERRGRGYGTEAVRLLVDHLFRTQTVERIGATCDVENVPSLRLLERLKLNREGRLARALFHHGRWHDVFVYGITRAEWVKPPPSG